MTEEILNDAESLDEQDHYICNVCMSYFELNEHNLDEVCPVCGSWDISYITSDEESIKELFFNGNHR